jgi:hypothetical protein
MGRVGLNGDRTEAVLTVTSGGVFHPLAWFDMKMLLFRKDAKTGQWSQVAELDGVST